MASRTTGSTGTIRVLEPLPRMRTLSPSGASDRFSDSASLIRRPQPQSRVSTASSRRASQSSRSGSVAASAIRPRALSSLTGRGAPGLTRGPFTRVRAALGVASRLSRKPW